MGKSSSQHLWILINMMQCPAVIYLHVSFVHNTFLIYRYYYYYKFNNLSMKPWWWLPFCPEYNCICSNAMWSLLKYHFKKVTSQNISACSVLLGILLEPVTVIHLNYVLSIAKRMKLNVLVDSFRFSFWILVSRQTTRIMTEVSWLSSVSKQMLG